MARRTPKRKGRIVTRGVGDSAQVEELWKRLGPEAALLWTWLVPWLDVHGNARADPLWVMVNVCPRAAERDSITMPFVREALAAMIDVGLLEPYEVDGRRYVHAPGFSELQTHLRPDRESPEYPREPARAPAQQELTEFRATEKNGPAPEPEGMIPIPELLEIGSELPDEYWKGHAKKAQVIAWWIDALTIGQHSRPPSAAITRQGKVAGRMGAAYTRLELVRAMLGITRLYPWCAATVDPRSPHRAWDLMTLEKHVTSAHAAPMPWEDTSVDFELEGA